MVIEIQNKKELINSHRQLCGGDFWNTALWLDSSFGYGVEGRVDQSICRHTQNFLLLSEQACFVFWCVSHQISRSVLYLVLKENWTWCQENQARWLLRLLPEDITTEHHKKYVMYHYYWKQKTLQCFSSRSVLLIYFFLSSLHRRKTSLDSSLLSPFECSLSYRTCQLVSSSLPGTVMYNVLCILFPRLSSKLHLCWKVLKSSSTHCSSPFNLSRKTINASTLFHLSCLKLSFSNGALFSTNAMRLLS